jgi:hypothetical protein
METKMDQRIEKKEEWEALINEINKELNNELNEYYKPQVGRDCYIRKHLVAVPVANQSITVNQPLGMIELEIKHSNGTILSVQYELDRLSGLVSVKLVQNKVGGEPHTLVLQKPVELKDFNKSIIKSTLQAFKKAYEALN